MSQQLLWIGNFRRRVLDRLGRRGSAGAVSCQTHRRVWSLASSRRRCLLLIEGCAPFKMAPTTVSMCAREESPPVRAQERKGSEECTENCTLQMYLAFLSYVRLPD